MGDCLDPDAKYWLGQKLEHSDSFASMWQNTSLPIKKIDQSIA